jgi:hypothetical protein
MGRLFLGQIDFQSNAASGAVAMKLDDRVDSFAIEALDRVVQSLLGANSGVLGDGVVDLVGPSFFFESIEHCLLILGGPFESLHHQAPNPQLSASLIPDRFGRVLAGWRLEFGLEMSLGLDLMLSMRTNWPA